MSSVTYETRRSPTGWTYTDLDFAYDYFNRELFGARLPRCMIVLHRKACAKGYYKSGAFRQREDWEWEPDPAEVEDYTVVDEISLNPDAMAMRTVEEILSTLVHEMVHLEQHHFGKPSRNGYHNGEWAEWMERTGLIPSHTGQPGGNRTGQRVTHYIQSSGPFERACAELIEDGFVLRWAGVGKSKDAERKRKLKFTCPTCGQNAWGKPDLKIVCANCGEAMC